MTPTETVNFLRYVANLFPTFQWDPANAIEMAAAWHETGLARISPADAKAAAQAVARRQAWVALADLLAEAQRIRDERLAAEPIPDPGTGDPQLYRQRVVEAIERMADGLHVSTPRALPPGQRRQGPPPVEWRQARGHDDAEQDARTVECPWCQAQPSQSCINPLGKPMRRSHDSRIQLAAKQRKLRAQHNMP